MLGTVTMKWEAPEQRLGREYIDIGTERLEPPISQGRQILDKDRSIWMNGERYPVKAIDAPDPGTRSSFLFFVDDEVKL